MQLGLCSAAAPDASLDELLGVCKRRGLGTLELRAGDAHGVGPGTHRGNRAKLTPANRDLRIGGAEAAERARAAEIGISGFRSESGAGDAELSVVAMAAGAPVLVDGGTGVCERIERSKALAAAGIPVLAVVRGSGAELERAAAAGIGVAWDADAAEGGLGTTAERVLRLAGDRLRHIRLLGGGPEAALHEGRGVGELMARLALAGYDGALVLSPGSRDYHVAWENWLGRRGGWGCGSRSQDPSLVRLDPAPPAVGGAP
jgi:hypothetical protein